MKRLGWKGRGLGKKNQGILEFKEIEDKSVNPKKLNYKWIVECTGCRNFNDKFIHVECTECGLVFNDFIKFQKESEVFGDSGLIFNDFTKFREESQIFDATTGNFSEKPSHIEPLENELEHEKAIEVEPDSSANYIESEKEKFTELEHKRATELEPDSSTIFLPTRKPFVTTVRVECEHCLRTFKSYDICYCPEGVERQNGTDLDSGSSDRDSIHLESDSSNDSIDWTDAESINMESDSSKNYSIEFKHPESEAECRTIECMRCYEHHKSKKCKMAAPFLTSYGIFPYYCPGDTREWVHEIYLETGEKVRVCKKHIGEKEDEEEVVFLGSFKKVGIGCADDVTSEHSQSGTENDPICID